MDIEEIKNSVCKILQKFNKYGQSISESTEIEDDLGVDSLGFEILFSEVESVFKIKVDSGERTRRNFNTVANICNYIQIKLNQG